MFEYMGTTGDATSLLCFGFQRARETSAMLSQLCGIGQKGHSDRTECLAAHSSMCTGGGALLPKPQEAAALLIFGMPYAYEAHGIVPSAAANSNDVVLLTCSGQVYEMSWEDEPAWDNRRLCSLDLSRNIALAQRGKISDYTDGDLYTILTMRESKATSSSREGGAFVSLPFVPLGLLQLERPHVLGPPGPPQILTQAEVLMLTGQRGWSDPSMRRLMAELAESTCSQNRWMPQGTF